MSAFSVGDAVRVRRAFPPGHVRTPYFVRGRRGVVAAVVGRFGNPEEMAYGRSGGPKLDLYRVRFRQRELWPDYRGAAADTADVDVYANWLEPAEGGEA
jgi:nitrile hydratase